MSADSTPEPPQLVAAQAITDPKHAEAFGALGDLELEFEKAEVEILKYQIAQTTPLYARRNTLTSSIPSFWPTVLDATPDFDQHVAPQDVSPISAITSITVTRPHPDTEPRDFILDIAFDSTRNEWFAEQSLTKQFWWRTSSSDGWSGLVSEPVNITWAEGRDLTAGETGRVYSAWKARRDTTGKEKGKGKGKEKVVAAATANGTAKKSLEERLAGGQPSFFTWFAWIGRGREGDREEDEEDEDLFNHGDELALTIADDVYPNAIKYFLEALNGGDDSDADSDMSVSDLGAGGSTDNAEADSDDEVLHVIGGEEDDDDSEDEAGGSSSRVKRHDITLSDDEEADEGSMRRKRVKK